MTYQSVSISNGRPERKDVTARIERLKKDMAEQKAAAAAARQAESAPAKR